MPTSLPMPGISGLAGGGLAAMIGGAWLIAALIVSLAATDRSLAGKRLRRYCLPPLLCVVSGVLVGLLGLDSLAMALGLPLLTGVAGVFLVREWEKVRRE